MPHFFLYSRDNCPLCDRLERLLRPYASQMSLVKRDIRTNPDWHKKYEHRIPVLVCGDQEVLEGRPQPAEVEHVMAPLCRGSDDSED